MWNEYKDEAYAEMDLWKENYHFYIIPIDLRANKKLSWHQFWSSFHIYAAILDLSDHTIGTLQHWDNIPAQKCSEQEWPHALAITDKQKN